MFELISKKAFKSAEDGYKEGMTDEDYVLDALWEILGENDYTLLIQGIRNRRAREQRDSQDA